MNKGKQLKFDIMRPVSKTSERFVETMRYEYNPLWRLDINALYAWIVDKRPSLKGKPFNIYPYDKTVEVIHFNQDI